jgi:hypothetical protein
MINDETRHPAAVRTGFSPMLILAVNFILIAASFCALPVSIEKGIRPHAFFPVG